MRAFAAFIESSDFVRVVVLLLLFTHSGTALSRLKGQASSRKGRPYRLLGKYIHKVFFQRARKLCLIFFFILGCFGVYKSFFPKKCFFILFYKV